MKVLLVRAPSKICQNAYLYIPRVKKMPAILKKLMDSIGCWLAHPLFGHQFLLTPDNRLQLKHTIIIINYKLVCTSSAHIALCQVWLLSFMKCMWSQSTYTGLLIF